MAAGAVVDQVLVDGVRNGVWNRATHDLAVVGTVAQRLLHDLAGVVPRIDTERITEDVKEVVSKAILVGVRLADGPRSKADCLIAAIPSLSLGSIPQDRLSDDGDDGADEPLLCDFNDVEEERADGVEIELFDSDDLLSDETEELRRELLSELLRPELLGELFDELPDEPLELGRLLEDLSDDASPLEPELRTSCPTATRTACMPTSTPTGTRLSRTSRAWA